MKIDPLKGKWQEETKGPEGHAQRQLIFSSVEYLGKKQIAAVYRMSAIQIIMGWILSSYMSDIINFQPAKHGLNR